MSDDTDVLSGAAPELFEMQMRGYSKRQVEEYAERTRRRDASLQDQLTRADAEADRLRAELAAAAEAAAHRPAREEPSDRVAQILRLAAEEASAQQSRTAEEVTRLRAAADQQAAGLRAEADRQARQMLTAARDQAARALASARTEAGNITAAAQAEATRAVEQARAQAESAVTTAEAEAKRSVAEATARAATIRDGAEQRLALLKDGHAETIGRLTAVRDGVTGLVATDTATGPLEDQPAAPPARHAADTHLPAHP